MLKQCSIYAIFLFFTLSAVAEQKKSYDQFDVHYSVVNSTFIKADVAKIYHIVRGKNRAFVNIAIRKNLPDGSDKAQKAIVSGISSDLMRKTPLQFKEITEQESIYYIAEFKFYDEEVRNFEIKIRTNPNKPAYKLKFSKMLYQDK